MLKLNPGCSQGNPCINVWVQKCRHTQMLKLNQGWFISLHKSPMCSFTLPDIFKHALNRHPSQDFGFHPYASRFHLPRHLFTSHYIQLSTNFIQFCVYSIYFSHPEHAKISGHEHGAVQNAQVILVQSSKMFQGFCNYYLQHSLLDRQPGFHCVILELTSPCNGWKQEFVFRQFNMLLPQNTTYRQYVTSNCLQFVILVS